jgi:glycosyltransferase involved in cell wall biosynthesis
MTASTSLISVASGSSARAQASTDAAPVAMVCNCLPPYRVHLHRRIARELPEIKLWTVLTGEDARWADEPPAEIRPIWFGRGPENAHRGLSRLLVDWRRAGQIIRWLRMERVRALVITGYNNAGLLRLIFWSHRVSLPCFIWGDSNINDDSVHGIKSAVKRLILPRLLRRAAGVMPCGRLGKEYFSRYQVPAERMFLFPLEADTQLIRGMLPEQVAEHCRKFGLAPHRKRLLFSGRLVECKRVDHLIEAFNVVAARRPEWDLVVAGDGPLAVELRRRVTASLAGRVLWLGHIQDQAALAAVYRGCDVLVLPSQQERWALVIQEAVAAGIAVVSSSVPGAAAELVRDGANGRIYPPGDVAALEECLLNVTDPDRIVAMKAASAVVMADWERDCDPIHGLQEALRYGGVLGP